MYDSTESEYVVNNAHRRYETGAPTARSGTGPIYIERTNPKIRIKNPDIASVVLEERRKTVSESGQIIAGEPYYSITFVLKDAAARAFRTVLNSANDQRFGLRFESTTLGVVRVIGPFVGNEFTYSTTSQRAELERAFAPIKDKLIWK